MRNGDPGEVSHSLVKLCPDLACACARTRAHTHTETAWGGRLWEGRAAFPTWNLAHAWCQAGDSPGSDFPGHLWGEETGSIGRER